MNCARGQLLRECENVPMLALAAIALAVTLSLLAFRYGHVIIRVLVFAILAHVILMLWVCLLPVFGLVRCIKMTGRGWRRKRWSETSSPAVSGQAPRIPNGR